MSKIYAADVVNIAAEEVGTVREVCLDDATPVEFGTVMFYLEPVGQPAPAPETA